MALTTLAVLDRTGAAVEAAEDVVIAVTALQSMITNMAPATHHHAISIPKVKIENILRMGEVTHPTDPAVTEDVEDTEAGAADGDTMVHHLLEWPMVHRITLTSPRCWNP